MNNPCAHVRCEITASVLLRPHNAAVRGPFSLWRRQSLTSQEPLASSGWCKLVELSENLVRLRTSEAGWRICPASLVARVPGKLTLDRLMLIVSRRAPLGQRLARASVHASVKQLARLLVPRTRPIPCRPPARAHVRPLALQGTRSKDRERPPAAVG